MCHFFSIFGDVCVLSLLFEMSSLFSSFFFLFLSMFGVCLLLLKMFFLAMSGFVAAL